MAARGRQYILNCFQIIDINVECRQELLTPKKNIRDKSGLEIVGVNKVYRGLGFGLLCKMLEQFLMWRGVSFKAGKQPAQRLQLCRGGCRTVGSSYRPR